EVELEVVGEEQSLDGAGLGLYPPTHRVDTSFPDLDPTIRDFQLTNHSGNFNEGIGEMGYGGGIPKSTPPFHGVPPPMGRGTFSHLLSTEGGQQPYWMGAGEDVNGDGVSGGGVTSINGGDVHNVSDVVGGEDD
ncbi:unnamed protein product, partial [Discosporangium mesarthrocarpum]